MKTIWKVLAVFLFGALSLQAAPEAAQQYGDRFLVCLQPDQLGLEIDLRGAVPVTGLATLDALMAERQITGMEPYLPGATEDDFDGDIYLMNIYRLRLDPGRSDLTEAIASFQSNEFVLYAEGEAVNRVAYIPNDPRWNQMWYLERIQADAAWDLWDMGVSVPGSLDIVLASVDTGVRYTHADLAPSVWINQAEVPADIFSAVDGDSDGLITASELQGYLSDYDGNGTVTLQDALHSSSPFMDGVDGDDWDNNPNSYVDDLFGWDVAGVTSNNDPDNDPMGSLSGAAWIGYRTHGTNVAGNLAAATDNGVGIASAVFNGRILSVKCLYDQDPNGYVTSGYTGMLYAAKAGANIINCSWGSFNSYSQSDQSTCNVIYDTYGALIVAASGNGNDNGTPNDDPHYPSAYENVVSVTAVGPSDNFSWATYGSTVDLSAPGENINTTTFLNNGSDSYESVMGTSFASPITSSAFGLLKAFNPTQSNDWLVEKMLLGSENIDDLNPDFAGGLGEGRVNVYNAIAMSVFPNLSFDSYSLQMVNDNGDGQLSPGEEAKLRVNLFNDPVWLDAADVHGHLTTTSPYVTVSDADASYGDINAGNVGVQILDRYQFSVAADAPSGNLPFSLEVTANSSSANPYSIVIDFEVEVSIWQSFFPIPFSGVVTGGTAVADLDGDGSREIIFGGGDSLLHVIGVDGQELAGFPVAFGASIDASPAIGDVDGDGDQEIVIGSLDYNLYLIQHDGSSQILYTSGRYIYAAAALSDVDDDGDLEIFVPTWNYELLGMHHDGTPLNNFPITLSAERMTSGAALADLDGDGGPEIIFGTWLNRLHAMKLDGTELSGFPVDVGGRVRSAPSVSNVDASNDGSLEIILGSDDDRLMCYSSQGSLLWEFTDPSQNIQTSPALSDLDGDGDVEIVFTSLDRSAYALDDGGNLLPGWPVATSGAIYSNPVIGDVDGDGLAEIFFGSDDDAVYGLHMDGTSVGGFPVITTGNVKGTATLEDLDGDGDVEVAIGLHGSLGAIDIMTPSDLGVRPFWRTARGGLQRTGFYRTTFVSTQPETILPTHLSLGTSYPNPFNPSTALGYTIPTPMEVKLEVLDIRGRVVATLSDGHQPAGRYRTHWNGLDQAGRQQPTGVYIFRLQAQGRTLTSKAVLLR